MKRHSDLDSTDFEILKHLQEDGRLSMTALGKQVSLSTPAVTERVRKLEDAGIIEGYRAVVNQEKMGRTIQAYILMTTHRCKAFRDFAGRNPLVTECHRLTGQYSYLVKVVTDSSMSLEAFIDEVMEFGEPYTMMNLSSPVPHQAF
ncbi:Lrp/AsnC family transcriptional regulator [Halobacillus litoralis]|uniref:Lrp/AsnC family transcriptional regulator n=1 Tax=Halobacillus litoralis TaxID=45668 RepID=UPI001CD5A9BC|nr:Lrp/AsnC family transcriptional regulator [Halobacillus litoralis]MCA0969334.1 Lrp/AsnC family transcriptional regulator [Halobacillus litoralis]